MTKAFDRVAAGMNQAVGYAQRESEVQALRDRVEELEDLLGMGEDDATLIGAITRLGPTPCRLIGIIRKRATVAPRAMIYAALYGHRPECDQPDDKIIDVLVSKSRPALAALGINIFSVHGIGYSMTPEHRRKLGELMAAQIEAAAA